MLEHLKMMADYNAWANARLSAAVAELDEAEEFSSNLTRKMGEIGLFGMFASEAYEGQEMDYLSYIIAVEEIARVDGSQAATIAAGNSLGIGPLYYFGSEEQKQKYLQVFPVSVADKVQFCFYGERRATDYRSIALIFTFDTKSKTVGVARQQLHFLCGDKENEAKESSARRWHLCMHVCGVVNSDDHFCK